MTSKVHLPGDVLVHALDYDLLTDLLIRRQGGFKDDYVATAKIPGTNHLKTTLPDNRAKATPTTQLGPVSEQIEYMINENRLNGRLLVN